MDIVIQRLLKAMNLTDDFYHDLNESYLCSKIADLPSNTIAEQAYCIVGARESYLNAFKAGQWTGFHCSLNDITDIKIINSKLLETHRNIKLFLDEHNIEHMNRQLLFDLLEHEIQHHGQLIRYAYANKIAFPKSWNARYTV